jgi:LCP family protein required for cell wall assembly
VPAREPGGQPRRPAQARDQYGRPRPQTARGPGEAVRRGQPPRRPSDRDLRGDSRYKYDRHGRLTTRTAARRQAARTGRIALALVSLLVLGGTWYGWSTVEKLTNGLSTADVIDPAAKSDSGPQNILLVGIDTRTDAQGNPLPQPILNQLHAGAADDGGDSTDTMIIIHIPAGGGKAVALSIPRDSYVDLAGGFGEHKINSAYTYAEVAAAKQLRAQGVTGASLNVQAAQAGAKNAIQTIEQFTGLQINHFASVNLVGFYDISKAIGGVQVCLRKAVHDSYSGASFPAGEQTIQGAQALAFVRQRHGLPNGDLDRIKRQQVFMGSMAHTILSAGVLTNSTKLNALVGAIQKSITLDKGWDILGFAQQLQSMSAGNIQFLTIPIVNITYQTPSDGDAVEVDPNQVQSFVGAAVSAADSGSTPASSSAAAPPPPPAANANVGITAQVYNSTGKQGLASDVLAALTGQGFTSGGTGNTTSHRTSSVVDYAPGDLANAQKVVQALGGGIRTTSSTLVSAGTVRVYLGKDYAGPKGVANTNTSAGSGTTTTTKAPPAAINAGATNCIN